MFECNICLKQFQRADNMKRHRNNVHAKQASFEDDLESDSPVYMSESESQEDYDSDNTEDMQENSDTDQDEDDPWDSVVEKAFEQCQPQLEQEVEILTTDGVSENEAREKVYSTMESTYRTAIMNVFTYKLHWFNAIKADPVYRAIKKTVNNLKELESYEPDEALEYGIMKRRFLFDKILRRYDPPSIENNLEEDVDDTET